MSPPLDHAHPLQPVSHKESRGLDGRGGGLTGGHVNGPTLTPEQFHRADVYPPGAPDGVIDVSDYLFIQQTMQAP